MADLLSPSGHLVCLEFPLYKDPAIEGPPWGVCGGAYWDTLVRGGTGIVNRPIPQELQDSQCSGDNGSFIRTLFIKPERSLVAGKGTDMLSVWSRK
jgi:methyl halide transferase